MIVKSLLADRQDKLAPTFSRSATHHSAAGKEVTVHAKNVSISGWSGSGYLLIDPDTDGGAYKIAGGTNGGFLKWVDSIRRCSA
jgi:hypothetical protein